MPTWISSCNGLVSEDVLITARITLKLCSYKFQWDATICDDILDVTPVIQTFTIINNYNYYAISEKLFSTLSLSASSHECSRVSSRERSNNTIVSVLIDKIYWISVADILVSDFIEQQLHNIEIYSATKSDKIDFAIQTLKTIDSISMLLVKGDSSGSSSVSGSNSRDRDTRGAMGHLSSRSTTYSKIICEFPLIPRNNTTGCGDNSSVDNGNSNSSTAAGGDGGGGDISSNSSSGGGGGGSNNNDSKCITLNLNLSLQYMSDVTASDPIRITLTLLPNPNDDDFTIEFSVYIPITMKCSRNIDFSNNKNNRNNTSLSLNKQSSSVLIPVLVIPVVVVP